jgi:nucleoside-diphosphate-sugar epimerase
MAIDLGQPGSEKTVLVTGHLGYVGAVTARVLAEAGIRVTGCDIDLFDVADFPTAGPFLQDVPNLGKDIREPDARGPARASMRSCIWRPCRTIRSVS